MSFLTFQRVLLAISAPGSLLDRFRNIKLPLSDVSTLLAFRLAGATRGFSGSGWSGLTIGSAAEMLTYAPLVRLRLKRRKSK
jgi:hypothetical protein